MVIAQVWLAGMLAASVSVAPHQESRQQAASAEQKSQAAAASAISDLGLDLDRIQRALGQTPRLQFDEKKNPVFRVEVFGAKPTIEDILGPEFWKGPVPYGGMTHQEFFAMVTPKDVQGYAAFSNEEGAAVAATSFLLQWTLQRAIQRYRETKDARAREAARQEVLEALDALEKARAKAGRK